MFKEKDSMWPEHKRMAAKRKEIDAVADFLESIESAETTYRGSRIYLSILVEDERDSNDLYSIGMPIENMLAQWAGINQKKLEKEKAGMLSLIRRQR